MDSTTLWGEVVSRLLLFCFFCVCGRSIALVMVDFVRWFAVICSFCSAVLSGAVEALLFPSRQTSTNKNPLSLSVVLLEGNERRSACRKENFNQLTDSSCFHVVRKIGTKYFVELGLQEDRDLSDPQLQR